MKGVSAFELAQEQLEGRSGTLFRRQAALNANEAAILTNNAAHDCQAQPGALAFGFGGEEWIENPGKLLLRYSVTRIADGKLHKLVGFAGSNICQITFTCGDGACLNDKFASIRHSIAGVDCKIEQYLLQLA